MVGYPGGLSEIDISGVHNFGGDPGESSLSFKAEKTQGNFLKNSRFCQLNVIIFEIQKNHITKMKVFPPSTSELQVLAHKLG